jgi:hypothetical protein
MAGMVDALHSGGAHARKAHPEGIDVLVSCRFLEQIGALPVLDAMVVELAKRRGFASLQDRWKQRWKAN